MSTPAAKPDGAFSDRLADALDRASSAACVGLDPVVEKLPEAIRRSEPRDVEAIGAFCRGVLEACRPHIPVVKFQSACFERFRGPGVTMLGELIGAARVAGFMVILDAKRGDIGVTAEHYAHATLGHHAAAADALTVSGYLGPDTVEPFLKPGRGAFVLVRTSNPGSDAVQSLRLADGRTVAEMMADHVASLGASRRGRRGLSDVGAVVGATKAVDAAALRKRMPDQIFLVPGVGAQGGTIDDVKPMLRPGARKPGELGVVVTASRSVIYPFQSGEAAWQSRIAEAAKVFSREVAGLSTSL